jgi:glycosyltransferase involved in cell wall biosynthesis
MHKLIIQIPCFNEEGTIAQTLAALPREVTGFSVVEWLVIDDGSKDRTVEEARRAGADHIVSLPSNQGLARAFMAGIETSLKLGADVIINTDADNQYQADGVADLVRPILAGESLIVVGTRPIGSIKEFSPIKKLLQRLGSYVVRIASGAGVPDAPSGFRAIHKEAAMRLCVFGRYTYTLETLIQAGRKNIPVSSVPVRVNPPTRPSRLVKSQLSYVMKSMITITRIFVLYKPLRFFVALGLLFLLPGLAIGLRFVWRYLHDGGAGHTQSLILAAILLVTAVIIFVGGVLSDLVAANRIMLEEIRMRLLRSEIEGRDYMRSGETPK